MARAINARLTWIPVTLGLALAAVMAGTGRSTAQTPEPMDQARTEEVVGAYLETLMGNGPIGDYYAEDIVVNLMDVNQQIVGRDAAVAAIVEFHQVAFAAELEIQTFLAGPGIAYAEIVFGGTHTGDFAGIPATGREVRVPYVAVVELAGDQITSINLYGPSAGLVQQLTAEETPTAGTPAS